eukprot:1051683-Alexandrium_andersonii.AAC.1
MCIRDRGSEMCIRDRPEALQSGDIQRLPPSKSSPRAIEAPTELGTHARLGNFRWERNAHVFLHVRAQASL